MHTLPDIRPWFKPVQPTIRETVSGVSYEELLPDERLSPFIYCYWQLKTHQPLDEPFYYRVVADGCVDWFTDLSVGDTFYVMGFSTGYVEFPLNPSFRYVGVRFLPTAFPLLFRCDSSELTNRFEELKSVVPDASVRLSGQVSPTCSFEECKRQFDLYFLSHLAHTHLTIDNRMFHALHLILKSQGTINIERDLDTGLSTRQLRRLFDFYVGDSPKVFSKVVRFQNLLNAKPSVESLRKNKLFFDLGYYDQAHFIKEFKTMYGLTPTLALR
jgi:hypothetical protein